MKQQEAARELAGLLAQTSDPLIRQEIVRQVSGFEGPTAESILRAAMTDSDPDVRAAACKAWGKRGGPEAAAVLGKAALSDADPDVRVAAIRALGQTGNQHAIAALGRALDDRDPTIQYFAIDSLRRVTGRDFGHDLGQWRQYVRAQGTESTTQPPSVAERQGGMF